MRTILAILFSLLVIAWVVTITVNSIVFDRNCEGYLKRAGDANTVQLAAENLAIAVKYAETEGLTSGYTSGVYRTPDEDVGFWYKNLKASLDELRLIKPDTSRLEQTNALMKLRETLLDEGQSTSVTLPHGISRFPNNRFYAFWIIMSLLLSLVFWLWAGDTEF